MRVVGRLQGNRIGVPVVIVAVRVRRLATVPATRRRPSVLLRGPGPRAGLEYLLAGPALCRRPRPVKVSPSVLSFFLALADAAEPLPQHFLADALLDGEAAGGEVRLAPVRHYSHRTA